MDYRRKANRKAIYPSFSLVVNQYLLRCLVFAHRRQLIWKNVPNHHPHPSPRQITRHNDWAMTTIDYRDEDDMSRARKPIVLPEPATRIDPYIYDMPNIPEATPELDRLPPVDDDALSGISFLNLEDEQTTSGDDERPAQSRRSVKGTRVFYTCKTFLDLCARPFRRNRRASI